MSDPEENKQSEKKRGRMTLMISMIAFVLFMINLLVGKANIFFNWHIWHLDNVGEFLLLFVASTLLIVSAMMLEKEQKDANEKKP